MCHDDDMSDVRPSTSRYPRGWRLWVPAVTFIVLGGGALAIVPGMLLAHWIPDADVEEQGKLLASAGQLVLLGLGGVIAVIGVALSLARHGQTLVDAEEQRSRDTQRHQEFSDQLHLERQRDDARERELETQRQLDLERELRARFVSAVDLLSAAAPVKRTAGLYALAALGDDWKAFGRPAELQVCIDVMCGYLRSGVEEHAQTPDEESVRRTGFELIRDHLKDRDFAEGPAWAGCQFPLARAPIWFTVSLEAIHVTDGTVIDLSDCLLTGGATLSVGSVVIDDRSSSLILSGSRLRTASSIHFDDANISYGGTLSLFGIRLEDECAISGARSHIFEDGELILENARLYGKSSIDLADAQFLSRGILSGWTMELSDEACVSVDRAHLNEGGRLWLGELELRGSTRLTAEGIVVQDGTVQIPSGSVSGDAKVSFKWAHLTCSGALNLSDTHVFDAASILLSRAIIDEGALTVPRGYDVGFPDVRLPDGATVAEDDVRVPDGAEMEPRPEVPEGQCV